MRKAFVLVLFAMAVAGLGLALTVPACGGSNNNTEKCTDPALPKYCSDKQCHECCVAADCTPKDGCTAASQMRCNANYACECTCIQKGSSCAANPVGCCGNLACDPFTSTCVDPCTDDGSCATAHPDELFKANLKCTDGVCDYKHCTRDGNCAGGTVCYNGNCVTPADCGMIGSCAVVPEKAITQEGATAAFSATAFLKSGALAPGVSFQWGSDNNSVASVDANGLVTGGAQSGDATITATVAGCSTKCIGLVSNYGAVTQGHTRVVVIDELFNTPVVGASVVVGAEAPVVTDALGIADVAVEASQANPLAVTVSKDDYNYVTAENVTTNNVLIHMGKLFPSDKAGGYRGEFDYNQIKCVPPHTCEVKLGLAGTSIPGNLINLNFDLILGDMVMTHIELGSNKIDQALPAGLVLGLNQTWFRQFFSPTGVPGKRVAWGLGGKLDLNTLISTLGPIISGGGGDIDVGALLASILPLFADFYTGLVPNIPVELKDKVIDWNDINDNDGDDGTKHCGNCAAACPDGQYCDPKELTCKTLPSGKTRKCPDLVADYDNFPAIVGGKMPLNIKMDQVMKFKAADFVKGADDKYAYDAVVILAGVIVKDSGLVPLGLSVGLDSKNKDDPPNGKIDDLISVSVSDVAGRIPEGQVKRVAVALALNVSALAGGITGGSSGTKLAGQVIFFDDNKFNTTSTIELDAFPAPPTATWNAGERKLTWANLPAGMDYLQAIFSGSGGKNWNYMVPASASQILLPAAPAAGDRADDANFVSIKLVNGASYADLVRFGSGKNIANLVELVKSFVFTEAAAP